MTAGVEAVAGFAGPARLVFHRHVSAVTFAAILDVGNGDVGTRFGVSHLMALGAFKRVVLIVWET